MEEIISLIPTILIIVISVALAQKKKQNQASQRNQQTRKKPPVQRTPRGMRTASQIMWEELQERASTGEAFTDPDTARDPQGGHHHHPDEAIYAGSMNAHTGEGEDACHDDFLVRPERIELQELAPLQDEVETVPVMNWNDRDDIVKGIIMQQVLERHHPRR